MRTPRPADEYIIILKADVDIELVLLLIPINNNYSIIIIKINLYLYINVHYKDAFQLKNLDMVLLDIVAYVQMCNQLIDMQTNLSNLNKYLEIQIQQTIKTLLSNYILWLPFDNNGGWVLFTHGTKQSCSCFCLSLHIDDFKQVRVRCWKPFWHGVPTHCDQDDHSEKSASFNNTKIVT